MGQFTNDDYKDVILANIEGGIQLFKGLKDGFFEQPIAIAGTEISARSLAKGDLDQDGDLDIVVGGDEQSNIALYNKGNELFESLVLTKEADDTYGAEIGDLNGDELLDIVFSNSESANVILLNRH